MKLKSFLILLVTGLLLFLFGCEHGAIPAEMLAKTPWYQKQLKLIRENNADQIQAPLAKQGIAVGRIIQKFSDNTLQVNGNVPFGNSSIRFSDADSAAKISEGDWIVARVMRDPKGRPPLIQDYWKVSVNTDSIPEEFHPDLEKLICLGIEYGWELKIEVSTNQESVTISNDAPEDGKRYTANMFQLYIGKQIRADRIKDGVYPNFVVVSAEKEAKTYILTYSGGFMDVQIGKVLKIWFPVYESLRLPSLQMFESSRTIAMHPSTRARCEELQRAFEKAGIPGTWEISDLGRMIFSYHTGSFEVYREWEKKVRSVSGPLEDGYIFTLSAPTEGPMSIPMTSKYQPVPYYEWTLLYSDFNYLSYGSGNEQVTYYWSFECGNALLFHQKEECDTLKRPDGEKILGRILEVMKNIPPWTLPKNEKKIMNLFPRAALHKLPCSAHSRRLYDKSSFLCTYRFIGQNFIEGIKGRDHYFTHISEW